MSSGGVRGVWSQHDLLTRHDRLLRLERVTREQKIEVNEGQIRLLERFSPEFREQQIKVHHTGELVTVDTSFAGTLKDAGRCIYSLLSTVSAVMPGDGSISTNYR